MNKEEHIQFWIQSSDDDWITVESLFKSRRYVHSLFFSHLTLEKLCKAHWIKDNDENHPPKTHNLVKLLLATQQKMSDEDLQFLEEFNDFQLESRYPDYLFTIQKICNLQYTKQLLERVKIIKQCLQENLPSKK